MVFTSLLHVKLLITVATLTSHSIYLCILVITSNLKYKGKKKKHNTVGYTEGLRKIGCFLYNIYISYSLHTHRYVYI